MTTFRIFLVFLVGFLIGVAILFLITVAIFDSFPNLPSWAGLVIAPFIVILAAVVANKIMPPVSDTD